LPATPDRGDLDVWQPQALFESSHSATFNLENPDSPKKAAVATGFSFPEFLQHC
jgi:hypothetical protein